MFLTELIGMQVNTSNNPSKQISRKLQLSRLMPERQSSKVPNNFRVQLRQSLSLFPLLMRLLFDHYYHSIVTEVGRKFELYAVV